MTSFNFNSINAALSDPGTAMSGVDFTGKSLKLDTEQDAQPIVDAINKCPNLQYLTLTGNTLGVGAAQAIAKALEAHPELKICRWSDMFTGRMKTEIPPALVRILMDLDQPPFTDLSKSALGEGMIKAGARLSVLELSDNAFGPIGVEGMVALLKSDVCSELKELRLNNNGLGITGGRLLAPALPSTLRVLVAGRNRLENDGAKALAKVFQEMGCLEELQMPQNGIYHAGMSALWAALEFNPRLGYVNLNDNTVGPRGAKAVAKALPRLKNLKSLNFGDCLLKSKGAGILANAIKHSDVQIETLDLSHNEIGRAACMEVVEALAPQKPQRLVLAGNSLGGTSARAVMKSRLGDAAALSDGEGDGSDQYETDSEEDEESQESEGSDEEAGSENSATEDAQHDTSNLSLDHSGIEEVKSDVERFLSQPSSDHLARLGNEPDAVIDTHLQSIDDHETKLLAYVEAVFMLSGLSEANPLAGDAARRLYQRLIFIAGAKHASAWLLANTMLRGLGLIKSETKGYRIRWSVPQCLSVLAAVIQLPYFPAALRDTLRFFISSKLTSMSPEVRAAAHAHPALLTQL